MYLQALVLFINPFTKCASSCSVIYCGGHKYLSTACFFSVMAAVCVKQIRPKPSINFESRRVRFSLIYFHDFLARNLALDFPSTVPRRNTVKLPADCDLRLKRDTRVRLCSSNARLVLKRRVELSSEIPRSCVELVSAEVELFRISPEHVRTRRQLRKGARVFIINYLFTRAA